MKTDYAAHDARYRELRAQGAPGWDTDEVYLDRERELAWRARPGRALLRVDHVRRDHNGSTVVSIRSWSLMP